MAPAAAAFAVETEPPEAAAPLREEEQDYRDGVVVQAQIRGIEDAFEAEPIDPERSAAATRKAKANYDGEQFAPFRHALEERVARRNRLGGFSKAHVVREQKAPGCAAAPEVAWAAVVQRRFVLVVQSPPRARGEAWL